MGRDAVRQVQGRRAWITPALCTIALGLATLAGAAEARASVDPGADLKTCFWTGATGFAVNNNILIPDAAATYWYSRFILPPGGRVVLRGDYPHARFFSLFNYHVITPYDGLYDRQIDADAGSSNPFAAEADRRVSRRSYTLTLTRGARPAAGRRAGNTIYTGTPGLSSLPQVVQLVYRVNLPDEGRDPMGDAGLPEVQYVSPHGSRFNGEAACSVLHNNGATLPNLLPLATPAYLALLAAGPEPTHPAVTPIKWYAFVNDARLAEPFLEGTPLEPLIAALPTRKTGPPVLPDVDVAMAYSYVDRSFGPDSSGHNVLVLRGRLPTTPRTFQRTAQMAGGTQMRYWSLCQHDSWVIARTWDCLFDEEVPTDRDRRYTIVVSLPGDRPDNARPACGVAWLDYGTLGDGVVKPRAGMLMVRNQVADPSFAPTIANVTRPGTEADVMGDYLPSGEYESRTQFEASGCLVRPGSSMGYPARLR